MNNIHVRILWMNDYTWYIIIKLRETTWNDVSNIVLNYEWMSNELLIMDYIILAYFWLYALFKKALSLKYAIHGNIYLIIYDFIV